MMPSFSSASPKTGSMRLRSAARLRAMTWSRLWIVRMAVARYLSAVNGGGAYGFSGAGSGMSVW